MGNHAFEFLTDRASQALVTLELKSHTPSLGTRVLGEEKLVGRYKFAVSELLQSPTCTAARTVQLPGTHVFLKLRLQLRFLGVPEVTSGGNGANIAASPEYAVGMGVAEHSLALIVATALRCEVSYNALIS